MKTWLLTIGLILLVGGLFAIAGGDSTSTMTGDSEAIRMKATGEPPGKMKVFLGWGSIVVGVAATAYGFRAKGLSLPSVKPLDQQAGPGDWTA